MGIDINIYVLFVSLICSVRTIYSRDLRSRFVWEIVFLNCQTMCVVFKPKIHSHPWLNGWITASHTDTHSRIWFQTYTKQQHLFECFSASFTYLYVYLFPLRLWLYLFEYGTHLANTLSLTHTHTHKTHYYSFSGIVFRKCIRRLKESEPALSSYTSSNFIDLNRYCIFTCDGDDAFRVVVVAQGKAKAHMVCIMNYLGTFEQNATISKDTQ